MCHSSKAYSHTAQQKISHTQSGQDCNQKCEILLFSGRPDVKFGNRAHTARYLQILGDTHILVQLQNCSLQKFRNRDFQVIRATTDPTATTRMANMSIAKRIKVIPKQVTVGTQAPENSYHYRKNPYPKEFEVAHKAALHKIEA